MRYSLQDGYDPNDSGLPLREATVEGSWSWAEVNVIACSSKLINLARIELRYLLSQNAGNPNLVIFFKCLLIH
jgi:hypothetical protein